MIKCTYVLVLCLLFVGNGSVGKKLLDDEKAQLIMDVIQHFKKIDQSELPAGIVPDPYPVENMTQSAFTFVNTMAHGLRKVQIVHVDVELSRMEINAELKFKNIRLEGSYIFKSGFYSAKGPLSIVLENLKIMANVILKVNIEGRLEMGHTSVQLPYEHIDPKFGNAALLQAIIKNIFDWGVGGLVMNKIGESVAAKLRQPINDLLDENINIHPFPNSIQPLDLEIYRLKQKMKLELGKFLNIANVTKEGNFMTMKLINTKVGGLSVIHREGDISVVIENNTMIASASIGAHRLMGSSTLLLEFMLGYTESSAITFNVSYITVNISLSQSLDTRNHIQLKDLNVDLGNIQIRSDGLGTVDYLIELSVNVLPNLLRYIIVDTVAKIVTQKVQDELNKINVEKTLELLIRELNTDDLIETDNLKVVPLHEEKSSDEDDSYQFKFDNLLKKSSTLLVKDA